MWLVQSWGTLCLDGFVGKNETRGDWGSPIPHSMRLLPLYLWYTTIIHHLLSVRYFKHAFQRSRKKSTPQIAIAMSGFTGSGAARPSSLLPGPHLHFAASPFLSCSATARQLAATYWYGQNDQCVRVQEPKVTAPNLLHGTWDQRMLTDLNQILIRQQQGSGTSWFGLTRHDILTPFSRYIGGQSMSRQTEEK